MNHSTSTPGSKRPERAITLSLSHFASLTRFSLALTVATLAIGTTRATAQNVDRVVHLWVDPSFGSDDFAGGNAGSGTLAWNPDWTSSNLVCSPTSPPPTPGGNAGFRPNDILEMSSGNVLLHAPHPFKTITAAVKYIVNTAGGPGGGPIGFPPLPYAAATSTSTPPPPVTWSHAIIHLMPGMYARGTGRHLANAMPRNNEVFPIFLPPRVSIQGTSALNTIIDLDGTGPAFKFGVMHYGPGSQSIPINGEETFIDSVTIANAARPNLAGLQKDHIAGIIISGTVASKPTITNCIFSRCNVGIAVAGGQGTNGVRHSGTTIANCTFAWNTFGIWNGEDIIGSGLVTGHSALNLLNNIFDASPHQSGPCASNLVFPAQTGFEGIAEEDLEVVTGATSMNFNAFAGVKVNAKSTVLSPIFPPTQRRTTTAVIAGQDIGILTGATGAGTSMAKRGVLFVHDLFCNWPFSTPTNFDLSPHDFRLSPAVAVANATSHQTPGLRSNMVDVGYHTTGMTSMLNGNPAFPPPGTLTLVSGSGQSWPYSSWRWDCEGDGNSRVFDHPRYSNIQSSMDLGADELGDLIVAGYRNGTTSFMRDHSRIPNLNNRVQYYLGSSLDVIPTPLTQPTYREYWEGSAARSINPVAPPPGWPTATYTPTSASWFTSLDRTSIGLLSAPCLPGLGGCSVSGIYPATVADITPHLLPDPHPWWQVWNTISAPLGLPPALVVYQECVGAGNYNFSLYLNPTSNRINPPGAIPLTGAPGLTWIDGIITAGVPVDMVGAALFHTFNAWGGTTTTTQITDFDSWGRGGTGAIRSFTLPATTVAGQLHASTLRFSTELPMSILGSTTNLQSFSVRIDDGPGGGGGQ